MPRRKGVNPRTKGNRAEKIMAKALSAWFGNCLRPGEEFHRTPRSGGLRWGKDNRVVGDIVPPDGFDFPYSVEIKSRQIGVISIFDWMLSRPDSPIRKMWKQCVKGAKQTNKVPMLAFRYNGMPGDEFFILLPRNFAISLDLELYATIMVRPRVCLFTLTELTRCSTEMFVQAGKEYLG